MSRRMRGPAPQTPKPSEQIGRAGAESSVRPARTSLDELFALSGLPTTRGPLSERGRAERDAALRRSDQGMQILSILFRHYPVAVSLEFLATSAGMQRVDVVERSQQLGTIVEVRGDPADALILARRRLR